MRKLVSHTIASFMLLYLHTQAWGLISTVVNKNTEVYVYSGSISIKIWGGGQTVGGVKICAKHTKICHFYAEMIKFGLILTQKIWWGSKKIFSWPSVVLPLYVQLFPVVYIVNLQYFILLFFTVLHKNPFPVRDRQKYIQIENWLPGTNRKLMVVGCFSVFVVNKNQKTYSSKWLSFAFVKFSSNLIKQCWKVQQKISWESVRWPLQSGMF